MRTIVQISDLHFGRISPGVLEPLKKRIWALKPDVLVVSGDLTQRARAAQFRAACQYLAQLPKPQIIVPGNHDVPMYRVLARFLWPLRLYKHYITRDMMPFYADDEMAIMGITTARSLVFSGGRISAEQMEAVKERMCAVSRPAFKILVSHHPLDLPPHHNDKDLVGRAQQAMHVMAGCEVDLLLAGHVHKAYVGHTAERYDFQGHSALFVQCSTTTSTRVRGEANSFNVLHLERPDLTLERYDFHPRERTYRCARRMKFRHTGRGWESIRSAAHGQAATDARKVTEPASRLDPATGLRPSGAAQ